MASIINNGFTADQSAPFTLADGQNANLCIRTADPLLIDCPPDCQAQIQKQDSAGNYTAIGMLNQKMPAALLAGPGTYRVVKPNSQISFGVDKD
jgi:hypothetical protein